MATFTNSITISVFHVYQFLIHWFWLCRHHLRSHIPDKRVEKVKMGVS